MLSPTDAQRQAFVEGWENAGGYTDDFDTSAPWACPWFHGNTIIEVEGEKARFLGLFSFQKPIQRLTETEIVDQAVSIFACRNEHNKLFDFYFWATSL